MQSIFTSRSKGAVRPLEVPSAPNLWSHHDSACVRNPIMHRTVCSSTRCRVRSDHRGHRRQLRPAFRLGLVCTMRDNASSLDSFICYNLALGFSMLFLYADDPEDEAVVVARRYPADRAPASQFAAAGVRDPAIRSSTSRPFTGWSGRRTEASRS